MKTTGRRRRRNTGHVGHAGTNGGVWARLRRIQHEIKDDHASLAAAGVAFYAFMAIFPALAVLVSIYGLVVDPATVEQQVAQLSGFVPEQARVVIERQLSRVASGSSGTLSLTFAGGLLVTLWSANKGIKGLLDALNLIYDERETRGFFRLHGLSLLLTTASIFLVIVTLVLLVGIPTSLGIADLGLLGSVLRWLRWPVLALIATLGVGVIYRYGPDRERAAWRWMSWGAAAATALWLAVSIALSFYSTRFGRINETFGSIGGVVMLLLWFFVSAYALLLGAELDAEMERHVHDPVHTSSHRATRRS